MAGVSPVPAHMCRRWLLLYLQILERLKERYDRHRRLDPGQPLHAPRANLFTRARTNAHERRRTHTARQAIGCRLSASCLERVHDEHIRWVLRHRHHIVRHLRDGARARPCHICAGTGLAPATSATGPPCHICGQPRNQSRCRCGRGEPNPGADVTRARAVPVQMWQG